MVLYKNSTFHADRKNKMAARRHYGFSHANLHMYIIMYRWSSTNLVQDFVSIVNTKWPPGAILHFQLHIINLKIDLIGHQEWVSEWCFTSLSTVFQSYRDGVCLWQILRVLPHSAASLEYRAANDPNTDTPPSHIILTPGQPVLVLSS